MSCPAVFVWKSDMVGLQMRIVGLSVRIISPGRMDPTETDMGQEQSMPPSGA